MSQFGSDGDHWRRHSSFLNDCPLLLPETGWRCGPGQIAGILPPGGRQNDTPMRMAIETEALPEICRATAARRKNPRLL